MKAESNENTRWQKIKDLVETQMAHSLELVEKLRSAMEEGLNKFRVSENGELSNLAEIIHSLRRLKPTEISS